MRQVAHDLLNPLTAIVGYAEILASTPGALDRHKQHAVERLHSEAMRAFEVSRRILALTQEGRPLTVSEQVHFMCMSIRHEINNPLTGILGLSEIALATGGLPPGVERRFQLILEMAEQIEEKDCHYPSILGTRKRAVAQF